MQKACKQQQQYYKVYYKNKLLFTHSPLLYFKTKLIQSNKKKTVLFTLILSDKEKKTKKIKTLSLTKQVITSNNKQQPLK